MNALAEPVRHATKIAVLLRNDLESWQRLNMTAFLVSGLGIEIPELIGEPYEDADGTRYLPMFRQPVLVFEADADLIARAHAKAIEREFPVSVFTSDLFRTNNDDDNRAVVRAVARNALDLTGIAMYGPKDAVDKLVKGAQMHP